jgi:hypothetical protein
VDDLRPQGVKLRHLVIAASLSILVEHGSAVGPLSKKREGHFQLLDSVTAHKN